MRVPSSIVAGLPVMGAQLIGGLPIIPLSAPSSSIATSVFDFARGFALSPSPIISPAAGMPSVNQAQELHRFQIDPTTDRCFWSEWENGSAQPSRIKTALSLRATPTTFFNVQSVLESTAVTTGEGPANYLRLGGADYDGSTFRINVNGGGDVFEATSTDGTNFTFNPTPVLTGGGHLLAMLRSGSDLFGIYSLNGGTPAATYHWVKRVAGVWTTIGSRAILACGGAGTPDFGGMEFHFPFLLGNRPVLFYEAYSGSPTNQWTIMCAYGPEIVGGDVEAALTGTWTKLGRVAVPDPTTSWAQSEIATPTYYDGRLYCQGTNIGDDPGEPVQGNPARWDIGSGLLRAA